MVGQVLCLLRDSMSLYLDPVSSMDALSRRCYWTDWTTLRSFLMASIPRLAASSPLRHLPNELLQRIAQLAHCKRVPPKLDASTVAEPWFTSTDGLTTYLGESEGGFEVAPVFRMPRGSGFQYVTVEIIPWYGTELSVGTCEIYFTTDSDNPGENDFVLVDGEHVPAWDGFRWSGVNQFDLLFNLDTGTVRLACNQVRGPEVQLHGEWWEGVDIDGSSWPEEYHPEDDESDDYDGRTYCSKLSVCVPDTVPAYLFAGGLDADESDHFCHRHDCPICTDE